MSLLKEFKLDKDLIQLPDKINYKIKGPKINFYSLIKDLVEGSKLYTKKYLQSVNLLQLCIDVLGLILCRTTSKNVRYDGEFIYLNSYMALKTFKKDLFSANNYFVLKRGFSSLIELIQKYLKEKDNVTIELDTMVTDVGKNHVTIDKRKRFGGTILCCLPYYPLMRLPKFKELQGCQVCITHTVNPYLC